VIIMELPVTPLGNVPDHISDETVVELEDSVADISTHEVLAKLQEDCAANALYCEHRARQLAKRSRWTKIAAVSAGGLTTLLAGLSVAHEVSAVIVVLVSATATSLTAADRSVQWEASAKKLADAARSYRTLERRATTLRASSAIGSEHISKLSRRMKELDMTRMLL